MSCQRQETGEFAVFFGFFHRGSCVPRGNLFRPGLAAVGRFCFGFRTAVNFLTSGKMRKQAWGKRGISLKTALFSRKATNSRCEFVAQTERCVPAHGLERLIPVI
jgi:hypothetical protein